MSFLTSEKRTGAGGEPEGKTYQGNARLKMFFCYGCLRYVLRLIIYTFLLTFSAIESSFILFTVSFETLMNKLTLSQFKSYIFPFTDHLIRYLS